MKILPNVETEVFALLGENLSYSISPLLHNTSYDKLGINALYLPVETDPENFDKMIDCMISIGFSGWNITNPYKEKILPLLSHLSSLAKDAGAVNTVLNRNGRLTGYNTDVTGFQRQLEESGFKIKDNKAAVIGAGGAARAVIVALANSNIESIFILNRSFAKAEKLADIYQAKYEDIKFVAAGLDEDSQQKYLAEAMIIIDTTPVGTFPDIDAKPVIDVNLIKADQLVIDLVYNPTKTVLLKEAEKRGATINNGLSMLIYQAEMAFKLWTKEMPGRNSWFKLAKKELLAREKEAAEKEKNE